MRLRIPTSQKIQDLGFRVQGFRVRGQMSPKPVTQKVLYGFLALASQYLLQKADWGEVLQGKP